MKKLWWPLGFFHDGTARVVGCDKIGLGSSEEAQAIIDSILSQQNKPHHVDYSIECMTSTELDERGILR